LDYLAFAMARDHNNLDISGSTKLDMICEKLGI